MALEPGNLSDLDEAGQEAWDQRVGEWVEALKEASPHWTAPDDPALAADPVPVDWKGYPQRPDTCLGTRKTLPLLDWRTAAGDAGRAFGHEEYLEWRAVRGLDGKLLRVELTTEVQEYWRTLAAHHPEKVLRLAGRFAGEQSAPWQEVFGDLNPFAQGVTPKQRDRKFAENMLAIDGPARSPYNNGTKAICFLSQSVNSLSAAVGLAQFGGSPHAKRVGGSLVRMSAAEAIAATKTGLAVDCRSSDPTIVDALIRLAWDGRKMSLHEPFGVYMLGIDTSGLALQDGSPVPSEWFEFQRGAQGSSAKGVRLSQRLLVEVPAGTGIALGDIIDTSLDEPLRFGGQLARLVRVGLYARVSAPGVVPVEHLEHALASVPPCGSPSACKEWKELLAQFEGSPSPADVDGLENATRRGRF